MYQRSKSYESMLTLGTV